MGGDSDRCNVTPQKLNNGSGKMIHPGRKGQGFTANI